jgi:hypothetical protein
MTKMNRNKKEDMSPDRKQIKIRWDKRLCRSPSRLDRKRSKGLVYGQAAVSDVRG